MEARLGAPVIVALFVLGACATDGPQTETGARSRESATSSAGKPSEEDHAVGVYETRHDLRAGDVVSGRTNRISAIVPPPGSGVVAVSHLSDGSTETLRVETRSNGLVVQYADAIAEHSDSEGTADASDDSEDPCQDDAYSLFPWRWNETFVWEFNASSTPDNIAITAAEAEIREATRNITHVNDDCGLTDPISATSDYRGREARVANIGTDSRCLRNDGHNVTGFGDLRPGVISTTCTWYSGSIAQESDTRLNKDHFTFYTLMSDDCAGRPDLQGVMTHERGHTFGLAHVDELSHGELTMSVFVEFCDNGARSLGLGDVRGLEQKY